MHEFVRQKLAQYISIQGLRLLNDKQLLRDLLHRDCNAYPLEMKSLIAAQNDGVPQRLLSRMEKEARKQLITELADDFDQTNGDLGPEECWWAVAAWAWALERAPRNELREWRDRLSAQVPMQPRIETVRDTAVAPPKTAPVPMAEASLPAEVLDEPAEISTPAASPPPPVQEIPRGNDVEVSADVIMQAAVRMACADGHLSLEELDELEKLSSELGYAADFPKRLIQRLARKGDLPDHLASMIWAVVPRSERGRIHMPPRIPFRVRQNAVVGCRIPAAEEVLAVVDTSHTGNGGQSIVFGRRGIYYENAKAQAGKERGHLPYLHFLSRNFAPMGNQAVRLDQQRVIRLGASKLSAARLVALLLVIKNWVALKRSAKSK